MTQEELQNAFDELSEVERKDFARQIKKDLRRLTEVSEEDLLEAVSARQIVLRLRQMAKSDIGSVLAAIDDDESVRNWLERQLMG